MPSVTLSGAECSARWTQISTRTAIEVRPIRTTAPWLATRSPTRTGRWNFIDSTATVASRPPTCARAATAPARSICESSQPPKMSPAGFVSAGMAMVCRSSGRPGFSSVGAGPEFIYFSDSYGRSFTKRPSPPCVGAANPYPARIMVDLFDSNAARKSDGYSAKDIEVLEGLEPVRRRPGMYIGGTDARALHHLAAEILDNAMDEAVAGHATRIEIEFSTGDVLTIRDNGRGIPIDPHPKFKTKSALEVIMTTLHAGGKFGGKVYDTSGGLHGVGASVVNDLSEWMEVDVARDKQAHKMRFERGHAVGKLRNAGAVNRRGTIVSFKPDTQIFGKDTHFSPAQLYRMAKSKAYLFRGVEIRWKC